MQSDIVNFQRQGWAPEEILAGLAAVLPKNIFLYVASIPNLAKLGTRFVLHDPAGGSIAPVGRALPPRTRAAASRGRHTIGTVLFYGDRPGREALLAPRVCGTLERLWRRGGLSLAGALPERALFSGGGNDFFRAMKFHGSRACRLQRSR